MMLENQAVAGAAPFIFFDAVGDGDGGFGCFGDFKFISSAPPLIPTTSNPDQPQHSGNDDDDWGEFVESSLGSASAFDSFPDPVPSTIDSTSAGKSWARPNGALPLSIFGDEEVDEPDPEPIAPLFSSSPSPSPGIGSGQGRDLKNLIESMYGQIPAPADGNGAGPDLVAEEDDFDWEFKDAASIDRGLKNEETSGLERKRTANGNGIKIDNRTQETEEAFAQLAIDNVQRELSDVYVAHDGFANGLNIGSVVVNHSHLISETNQQSNYMDKGNGFQTCLENGDKNDLENCWKLKGTFLEFEGGTGALVNQKIANAEAVMLMPIVEIGETMSIWGNGISDKPKPSQETMSIWEKGISDMPESSYTNGKEKSGRPFEDNSWSSFEPMDMGINHNSGAALNYIVSNLYEKSDQVYNVSPTQDPSRKEPKSAEVGPHSILVDDDNYFDEMHWEFQKASETTTSDQYSKLDQNFSTESSQNTYLDLYCRLQEECLVLIACHLDNLKKAREVAVISGEQAKVIEIDNKLQSAYKKLQEATISENYHMGENPSSDVRVRQLLDVARESHFQAIEQEYCLQQRILSAEKDLNATIELFEHTISVIQILGMASAEEQQTYIITWSKMAMACARELQHGATIFKESIHANAGPQILSRGNRYFVALAEIYRVSEILRASSRLYKPWVLASVGDSSELLTSLEKCTEAWRTLGLEEALENDDQVKPLLVSVRSIRELNELSLRSHAFSHENKVICRLSLLPMGVLQGLEIVVWNEENFCLKLANMWANRLSCRPPHLPHIHVGYSSESLEVGKPPELELNATQVSDRCHLSDKVEIS